MPDAIEDDGRPVARLDDRRFRSVRGDYDRPVGGAREAGLEREGADVGPARLQQHPVARPQVEVGRLRQLAQPVVHVPG